MRMKRKKVLLLKAGGRGYWLYSGRKLSGDIGSYVEQHTPNEAGDLTEEIFSIISNKGKLK